MTGFYKTHKQWAEQILMGKPISRWVNCCMGMALLAIASSTHAMSLGRMSGTPVLGQPFTGSIAVNVAPDERLDAECVKADLYSGEEKINPNNVRTDVIGEGENRQIRIRSTQRLTEPLLTVYLEAGCQARVSRRYTLFVDPLSVAVPSTDAGSASETTTQAPSRIALNPAPITTSGNPAYSPDISSRTRAVAAKAPTTRPVTRSVVKKASKEKPATASAEAPRSKLTVDLAAPLLQGSYSSFQLSRELSFPTDDAETARKQELRSLRNALMAEIEGKVQPGEFAKRIQDLEAANDKLLKDAAAARAQATAERAKREQIEQSSLPSWWLYAALGALALALGATYVFWRRSRAAMDDLNIVDQVFSRHHDDEVDVPLEDMSVPAGSSGTTAVHLDADSIPSNADSAKWYERFMPGRGKTSGPAELPATLPMSDEAQRAASKAKALTAHTQQQEYSDSINSIKPRDEQKWQDSQRRVVSAPLTPHEQLAVNEVADISQEAEFFMEIGEYERAINLLEGSLDTEQGLTPVPQMYLLDMYRKTGKHEAYESLRERFRQNFNAYVPGWDEDPSNFSRDLSDYPRALEQVCRSWRSDNIVPTLESLMVDDTRGSRLGFDLPAYREVVFLYGIAKQLELDSEDEGFDLGLANEGKVRATHESELSTIMAGNDVDFEIPLGAESVSTASTQTQVKRASSSDANSLDFDLNFDQKKPN